MQLQDWQLAGSAASCQPDGKGIKLILPQSNDTLWPFAYDNAVLVRDALARALQLYEQDQQTAIASVQTALSALARLRARAPESSVLLGTVLFFGIELEVRLTSAIATEKVDFEQAIGGEMARTEELIAAIKKHLDRD